MKKNIFFLGTPQIAVPSLEAIAKLDSYNIVGVGVFPDRKIGRKQIPTPCPVKAKALAIDLPIFEIETKEQLVKTVQHLDFDIGIVIAFGLIFPATILTDSKFINIHFSLLPQYRGASPIQSAILDGQETSGITWQTMVKELDAGDICFQKSYDIHGKKTSDLWHYFALETAHYFPEFLNKYFDQSLEIKKQQSSKATFCGKFTKADGEVNFKKMTAEEIDRAFRAFDVWPGIFVPTVKGNVKIKQCTLTRKTDPKNHQPKDVEILCKNNTKLYLEYIQIPGKKVGKAVDILKNFPHLFETGS